MHRVTSGLLVTLLMAFAACHQGDSSPPPYPPDEVTTLRPGIFEAAILVRVVESTPVDLAAAKGFPYVLGTVLVLKSWWGPFSAGQVLQVRDVGEVIRGRLPCNTPYPLRAGDELIVGTQRTEDPILVVCCSTWPAESISKDLMAALSGSRRA